MEIKICTTCNIEQPLTDVYLKRGKPRAQCRTCHSKYYRSEYKTKTEQYKARQKSWRTRNPNTVRNLALKGIYGITLKEWEQLLTSQDNKCGICGNSNTSKKNFHTDHNHTTGQVRGLLCYKCNSGIGSFDDKIDILEKAITYLKKYNN